MGLQKVMSSQQKLDNGTQECRLSNLCHLMTTWSLIPCDGVLTSLHHREQYFHIYIVYILF